jgi:cell wall-associated NlpC family hydrolase
MKFKFAAIGVMALTLTTCSSPSQGLEIKPVVQVLKNINNDELSLQNIAIKQNKIEHRNKLIVNTKSVHKAVRQLNRYVGKTWYVFSGATPSGWDCSGLVMWTYEQLNINLEHRASIQARSGRHVNNPKLGDIVVFKYKGHSDAYHVGIYIGNGQMIHAPNKNEVTRIESIKTFAGKNSNVSFVRLIETI